jgi:biopolymer transport protein ExbD
MKLANRPRKRAEENLVPLINIVFLILIFFLVASTIRPFSRADVRLAETGDGPSGSSATRTIVVKQDGGLLLGGKPVTAAELAEAAQGWAGSGSSRVTLVADAELEGTTLVETVAALNGAGIRDVKLLTRRSR